MLKTLWVGCGGFLGSAARYLFGDLLNRMAPRALFPFETLIINVSGCLAIGILAGLAESRGVFRPETRAFLFVGVLGGYTTFSTFGYETFQLLRDGQWLPGTMNALAQVFLGLAAVWAGHVLARLA
jgi:CrcB protein